MNLGRPQKTEIVVRRLPTADSAIRASFALLSAAERQRAWKYKFERDRRQFIARRAHLRTLIAERVDREPSSIQFSTGPHGKPFLVQRGGVPALSFSVSHSGELTMYGLSTEGKIGVDVEAIKSVADADRIASLAFSAHEQALYRRLPVHQRPLAFLQTWTRKEAFAKATGEGICDSLPAFDVMRGACGRSPHGWRIRTFCPEAGFVAAVVMETTS